MMHRLSALSWSEISYRHVLGLSFGDLLNGTAAADCQVIACVGVEAGACPHQEVDGTHVLLADEAYKDLLRPTYNSVAYVAAEANGNLEVSEMYSLGRL